MVILSDGIRVHRPAVCIPWNGTNETYAAVLGSSPEDRVHTFLGTESTSTEHVIVDAVLVPEAVGVLRVRLQRDGPGWLMTESVLYMGTRDAPAEDAVAGALESVLGPFERLPANNDHPRGHSELRRWHVGPVTVTHGWFEEYSAHDDWSEQEVRVQRVDRPVPWR